MVGALVVYSSGEEALISSICVHDPDTGGVAGFGSTEEDMFSVGGFGLAEVPDGWI